MAKLSNQKRKLVCLLQILWQDSDEEHPLSVPQLVEKLEQQGVSAERKSLYSDIQTLNELGYDIQKEKRYYMGDRLFSLPELKLLVDAVQSSKFITSKKSGELIKKLEKLCSKYQAQELDRQVYVTGRVKSMNQSIYYNIDALHRAINDRKQVQFKYFRYAPNREKVLRHNGKLYQVSPYALLRSDENYYLVAYDGEHQEIRHYRVDKMTAVKVQENRSLEGWEAYQSFDLGRYARIHFGMFRGKEAKVCLRCENDMADVIIDRFGENVMLVPDGDGYFTCTVELAVSPQFFGWLFGLGNKVAIQSPNWVKEDMAKQLEEVKTLYTGK